MSCVFHRLSILRIPRQPRYTRTHTLYPCTTLLRSQVSRRLALSRHVTRLQHVLDGSFAWIVPYYQHSQIEGHLAGLAALFNAPLTIGELKIDVAIAFGVNDEFEGSNAQRLAAALVEIGRAHV